MNWDLLIETAGRMAADTVEKYGPVAWETTLWVVRLDALASMITFLLVVLPVLILYKLIWKKWGIWADRCYDSRGANGFRYTVLTVTIFLIVVVGVTEVFGFWNWIQLLYPELYLAHEAIEKVLK